MSDTDDNAESRLRTALEDDARTVEATDGSLDAILARAHDPHRRSSWVAPVMAAAAAVAVIGLASAIVLANRPHATPQSLGSLPAGHTSLTPATSAVSSTPTRSTSHAPTTGAGTSSVVPVYFAASYTGSTLLYREYRPVTTQNGDGALGAVTAAVESMLGGSSDSDYRVLWGQSGTGQPVVTISGSTASVAMPSAPSGPIATALQELVYTVTGADPAIHTVSVSYPGGSAGPTARASAADILAPVWITAPTQNATVASPVLVAGYASVFEATVTWEIALPDGSVVAHGNTLATIASPARGSWSFRVPLPKGRYIVRAFAISPKDGSVRWPDTKEFTVKH